jgi:hypothetical protein
MPVRQYFIPGGAGKIEVAESSPETESFLDRTAIAVIAHPHPLFGGTMDNKVVTTLARAFYDIGAVVLRFNFRGVGQSEGVHDQGRGETGDLIAVVEHARVQFGADVPLWLAGFSFGGAVALHATERVACEQLVLVAPAFQRLKLWSEGEAGRIAGGKPPARTVLIHGETDETVPLADSFVWARGHDVPVVVIPGADHFFHRKLHLIREVVMRMCRSP